MNRTDILTEIITVFGIASDAVKDGGSGCDEMNRAFEVAEKFGWDSHDEAISGDFETWANKATEPEIINEALKRILMFEGLKAPVNPVNQLCIDASKEDHPLEYLVEGLDDESFNLLKEIVEDSENSRSAIQQRIDNGSDSEGVKPWRYSTLYDAMPDVKERAYFVRLKNGNVARVFGLTIDHVLIQTTFWTGATLMLKPLSWASYDQVVAIVEKPSKPSK